MKNFIYSIPTTIYFGEGQVKQIAEIVKPYGKRVLIVYGGGSIKRNGIYDDVINIFKNEDIHFVELSGVEPNPRIETVREGIRLCRENEIEVVLPIGGGSTIDCAKAIAGGVSYPGDAWDTVLDTSKIISVLPIVSILTLSATGSEMDCFAVISDMESNDKIGMGHKDFRPKASILDPSYTFTVNKYQSAAGTADIMSHILETYFSNNKGFLQDRMAESLLKTCIEFGVKVLDNPEDYEARSNLMWASSWAINDLIKLGKPVEWSVHPMEHQLSAYYDITHGVGLAILTPHWMNHVLDNESLDKFVEYARNVWNVSPHIEDKMTVAKLGIEATANYFKQLGIASTLKEVGIDEEHLEIMALKASADTQGAYRDLDKDDILNIYKAAL